MPLVVCHAPTPNDVSKGDDAFDTERGGRCCCLGLGGGVVALTRDTCGPDDFDDPLITSESGRDCFLLELVFCCASVGGLYDTDVLSSRLPPITVPIEGCEDISFRRSLSRKDSPWYWKLPLEDC
jgi:hypothetical protein